MTVVNDLFQKSWVFLLAQMVRESDERPLALGSSQLQKAKKNGTTGH